MLRHVLLEDVVLNRSPELFSRNALTLRRGDVERPQNDRRAVYRHRGRDLVEGNAFEQHFHVGQAGDGYAALSYLALRPRMIGVVAHQCWKVESYREAGLPVRQ